MKKAICFILAVLLLCGMIIPASAAEATTGTCGTGLSWRLENGTLTVSGTGAMTDYAQGKAPWYANRGSITEAVIQESVTTIGAYAFYGCAKLKSVQMPDSITTIGNYAFSGCDSLTGVSYRPGFTTNWKGRTYIAYYGSVVKANLADNGDGTFTRVEYNGEKVIVETYSSKLQLISARLLDMELPIYGGYYQGSDSHYLIFGQENDAESDSAEVIRVVRYSKDWKRQSSVSVYGANTTTPFRAGSLRCVEYNGYLYIRTSHEMYTHEDGLRHQANVTLNIRLSDMKLVDYFWKVGWYPNGYVSHSFNQFILVDEGKLVAADHGDAYPRSVAVTRYKKPAGQDTFWGTDATMVDALPITGNIGYNITGVEMGGFEASSTAYLTAGATIDQSNFDTSKQKNVYVTATSKSNFSNAGTTVHYLTNYAEDAGIAITNLHFVKLSSTRFALLWMEQSNSVYTLRFAQVDGSGKLVGSVASLNAMISTCPPIYTNGKLIWYVTKDSGPAFVELDPNAPQKIVHNHIYQFERSKTPTYTESGLITSTCVFCNGEGPSYTLPSVSNLDEYELSNYKAPTCTSYGKGTFLWKKAAQYGIGNVAKFSQSLSALGHDIVYVPQTPSTCSVMGTKSHYHCNRCEKDFRKSDGTGPMTVTPLPLDPTNHVYDPTTHLCVCGAKDPAFSIPKVTATAFSLSFEDEILVNFYYTAENTQYISEHGMLVFYDDPGTADFGKADGVYAPEYVASSDCYMAHTPGIAAKEMGDERYYCAYAKLTDGSFIYSELLAYSPMQYAMNLLDKDSTSQKQKALCVAMLNYGAAAQEYFGYRTDDLMNAGLTDPQKALAKPYDASLFQGAVAADPNKTGSFAPSGFGRKSATVSFEGAFAINYYLVPTEAVAGDMQLYVWNYADYAAASQLTTANASRVIAMEALASGFYWGQVDGIAPKSIDDTYYVAAVYTDEAGNTHSTGVIAYSLSRYCMNSANGNMSALAQATAMYGYYAKEYFSK